MRRRSTAGRSPLRPQTARQSFLVPLLAVALGLALLVIAFPRLVAALHVATAGETVRKLETTNAPSPAVDELLAAREALRLGLAWDADGRTTARLAHVDLMLAAREFRAGGNPQPMVGETIEAAREALALAPAQARAWLILAEATLARTGNPGDITGILIESMRASPHDIWLAPSRAELGLRAWPWLDPAAREMVAHQIRLTAIHRVDRAVVIAKRAGDPTPVREALAGEPEKLRRFDVLYLQTP